MKDLSEQLKEALSQIVLGEDAEGNPYHFGDEDGSEMQQGIELITAFINDNYVPRDDLEMQKNQIERDKYLCGFYPKEFVEWCLHNAEGLFPEGEYEEKWRVMTETHIYDYFTTDELFEYWKTINEK